jgi:hypothetical protein
LFQEMNQSPGVRPEHRRVWGGRADERQDAGEKLTDRAGAGFDMKTCVGDEGSYQSGIRRGALNGRKPDAPLIERSAKFERVTAPPATDPHADPGFSSRAGT